MIDFLRLSGPFVVIFYGEGRACYILQTAREVLDFLMHERGGGLGHHSTQEEVISWLNDDDHWTRGDGYGEPFEWSFASGEICSITVVRVTPDNIDGDDDE